MSSVILDPFAGSGTALIYANELGRKYIGIDRSEEAVKVMRERLTGDYMFIDFTEI